MIADAFVNIAFIKINKRLGDAAPGAGEASKHFKRAKGLAGIQMMIPVVQ